MRFLYDAYKNMLNKLKEYEYEFCGYMDWKNRSKAVILRHDIDMDIEKACRMALIEQSGGVSSTYFVLLTSDFYNVFSKESSEGLQMIMACGHEIGLHFDELRYPELAGNISEIKNRIIMESALLGEAVHRKINIVSMHRPGKEILNADLQIPGMINSYGREYFRGFKYMSDSRRKWRESPDEIIMSGRFNRLHILTHAFWYSDQEKDLHDSVCKFVNDGNRRRYYFLQSNFSDLESVMTNAEVN